MNQKGFTLIELMVVVAVIGILVSLALPQYQKHIAKAQISQAFISINEAKYKVQENMQENKCSEENGVIKSNENSTGSVACHFTYKFNEKASNLIANKAISGFFLANGTISKDETETTVDSELLPKAFMVVEQ